MLGPRVRAVHGELGLRGVHGDGMAFTRGPHVADACAVGATARCRALAVNVRRTVRTDMPLLPHELVVRRVRGAPERVTLKFSVKVSVLSV